MVNAVFINEPAMGSVLARTHNRLRNGPRHYKTLYKDYACVVLLSSEQSDSTVKGFGNNTVILNKRIIYTMNPPLALVSGIRNTLHFVYNWGESV